MTRMLTNSPPTEQFYKKILRQFGCLLGTWVRNDYPFGGLLDVKFQENSIVGSTWRPHPSLGRPLKKTGLFSIKIGDNGDVIVECSIDKSNQRHSCVIEFQNRTQDTLKFQSVCTEPAEHRSSCSFYSNTWTRDLNISSIDIL